MKKLIKTLIIFIFGIFIGYYFSNIDFLSNLFNNTYKAFQIGVYTDFNTANIYAKKYKNSLVIKDNELYRVYIAILKNENNIENMSKYLSDNNISYYLKDIKIDNKELNNTIEEYENIMNSNNKTLFLEINKLIIEKYKENI